MIYDVGGTGEWMQIGTVGKARGLKGHVRVRPFTDDPERFYDLDEVWLQDKGGYTPLGIAEADVNGDAVYLRFNGVEDRTAAEGLNGKALFIKRKDAVELPPGVHFISDVIGCTVTDDKGNFHGKLCEVMQPGATDVYVLRGGPRGEILFPALKDVILSMDTASKKIVVDSKRFEEVAVLED